MSYLGISIDLSKNLIRAKKIIDISSPDSKVNILIIPTNEELEIAEQTYNLIT